MGDNHNTNPPVRFWQQNLNKSLITQLDLLNQVDPKNTDFIFIQEPHIDFLNLTRANHHWTVVYPSPHHDTPVKTRSITLVSRTMSKNNWHQVPVPCSDVMAVKLTSAVGPVTFYNIYNACDNSDTLSLLQNQWSQWDPQNQQRENKQMVWLGDFNKHHPLWDALEDTHLFTPANLDSTNVLVTLLGDHNMEMALPAGIPTLQAFCSRNFSCPDNIFCSADLLPSFIECNTHPHLKPAQTDHLPIRGIISITLERAAPPPRYNWWAVDWDEFQTKLTLDIQELGEPRQINDKDDFTQVFSMLTMAIQSTTEQSTPRTKLSSYTKQWWSLELAALHQEKQCLRNKSYCLRSQQLHPVHARRVSSGHQQVCRSPGESKEGALGTMAQRHRFRQRLDSPQVCRQPPH